MAQTDFQHAEHCRVLIQISSSRKRYTAGQGSEVKITLSLYSKQTREGYLPLDPPNSNVNVFFLKQCDSERMYITLFIKLHILLLPRTLCNGTQYFFLASLYHLLIFNLRKVAMNYKS